MINILNKKCIINNMKLITNNCIICIKLGFKLIIFKE